MTDDKLIEIKELIGDCLCLVCWTTLGNVKMCDNKEQCNLREEYVEQICSEAIPIIRAEAIKEGRRQKWNALVAILPIGRDITAMNIIEAITELEEK